MFKKLLCHFDRATTCRDVACM